jgi:hypothetical protein
LVDGHRHAYTQTAIRKIKKPGAIAIRLLRRVVMSLASLIATGANVWLDGVEPHEIARNHACGITGATSNPTIISKIIGRGHFDERICMSLTMGIILLSRLARMCGPRLEVDGNAVHAFPRPQDVAHRDPESLRRLGFSRQKVRAIIEAARAIVEGNIDLELLVESSDEAALAELHELRGVGRWTAEYILLRGLGRWHIFPGDDVEPAITYRAGWAVPT